MSVLKSSKKMGIFALAAVFFLLSAFSPISSSIPSLPTEGTPNVQQDSAFLGKTADVDTWISFVLNLLDINPSNIADIIDVLDLLYHDGVDAASLGIILIEDLIEFLDDATGVTVFDDLWYEFMPQWIGWGSGFDAPLSFQFWNFNEPDEIPVDTSGLRPDFAGWVEFAYGITGVQWSEVPHSVAQINRLMDANVDPVIIALIMVEDFLEFMDDYDASVVAFPCLWEQIIDFNWIINHRLSWRG